MADFEIRSKSQFRMLLDKLVARGTLRGEYADDFLSKLDLPETVSGIREGKSINRLGGLRQPARAGEILKGRVR